MTSVVAQETPACKLRCTTLYQIFDDDITATIHLACDGDAITCQGTGLLQINRALVATRVSAQFMGSGIVLTIDTAEGFLKPNFGPGTSFELGLDRGAALQSKSFPARWQSAPNAIPSMNRYIGGHFKLTVDNYAPAPARPQTGPALN